MTERQSRRRQGSLALLALVCVAAVPFAANATSRTVARSVAAPASSSGTAPIAPACIASWPETRARAYGYDHVVHVRNDCKKVADCWVSTDVAPEPVTVTLAVGEHSEVTTFLGSPAREFTPRVACKLR